VINSDTSPVGLRYRSCTVPSMFYNVSRREPTSVVGLSVPPKPVMTSNELEMAPMEARESAFNQLHTATEDCVREGEVAYRISSVNSLTIMAQRPSEAKTMMHFSDNNSNLLYFLIFTGNYWPRSAEVHLIPKLAYLITRLGIWGSAALNGILIYIYVFYAGVLSGELLPFLFIVLYGMWLLGTLSVLPAQYYNVQRLFQRAETEDYMAVDGSLRITAIYGVFSVACVVLSSVLRSPQDPYSTAVCGLNVIVVLALMFNMFFLAVDLTVSLLLLDQLHVLADKKMLTMDTFNTVRAEIHRRVVASKLACDLIIVPALAATIGIVMVVFIMSRVQGWDHGRDDDFAIGTVETVGSLSALAIVQLKELFFVAVAFTYVAKVNARADELTTKLSDGFWGHYGEGNSAAGLVTFSENVKVSDLHRVSVYMSALSKPISFTLLFKRVSWRDVIVGGVSLGVSIVVGVVKNIVASTVT
jgi:hypothetical protein